MTRVYFLAAWALCLAAGVAQAQILGDANWQEGEVPPPPSFRLDRLVRFEVLASSPIVYAVDPQTFQISPTDRVVRYVMVASSPSGARNVFYEGIRCPTGEVKTYGHHNGQAWVMAQEPQWTLMSSRPSRHAFQLARQGACDGNGTPLRVEDVVRSLTQAASASTR